MFLRGCIYLQIPFNSRYPRVLRGPSTYISPLIQDPFVILRGCIHLLIPFNSRYSHVSQRAHPPTAMLYSLPSKLQTSSPRRKSHGLTSATLSKAPFSFAKSQAMTVSCFCPLQMRGAVVRWEKRVVVGTFLNSTFGEHMWKDSETSRRCTYNLDSCQWSALRNTSLSSLLFFRLCHTLICPSTLILFSDYYFL